MKNTGLFLLSAILALTSCLKDENFKREYDGFDPVNQSDDWSISTPENENMNRGLLEEAYKLIYKDNRYTIVRSLIVIRNGKLVAEAYPHELEDKNRIANIQSMTKSFTSILTGIAIHQNLIDSVGQTLYSIYPEHFVDNSEKSDITIRNCLTMKAGIGFNNGDDTQTLYQTENNSVEFVLSKDRNYNPGIVFHYNDGAPQLVSAAIQKKYGKPFSEFANEYLFRPLGITDWKWESAKDGNTFGTFSLYLKPRDLAKFGQLLIQNGKWNNNQLIDSSWIAEATQPWVNSGDGGGPDGYYFWIYPAYNAYVCYGHGGQKIMVFPDKDLVIVYTSWAYTSDEFFDTLNEVAGLITRSCY